MVTQTEIFFFNSKRKKPVVTEASPILEPFKVGSRLAEEFKLHLFKLANTEDKVAGGDFVTEGFTDLTYTERKLFTACTLNVCKVNKNALSSFGTEVNYVFSVLGNTLEGFKHKVKLTNIGKIMLSAGRTGDIVVFNEILHFLLRKSVNRLRKSNAVFGGPIFNKLVGAETLFTFAAIHKRVREAAKVSRSNPSLRVHEDCGVKSYVVGIFLNKFFPPCFFNVVFKLGAKRAVVPCISQTAVNFGAGKYKAASFTKSNDFFHGFFAVIH